MAKHKTASILLNRYCGKSHEAIRVDVPARIIGDLAVHRDATLQDNGEPSFLKGWTVLHIPTGASVRTAYRNKCHGAKQRELMAWCEAWQAACPEYFAAIKQCASFDEVQALPGIKELTRKVFEASRAIQGF